MPRLVTNISAKLFDNYIGNIGVFTSLTAQAQFEDYINLNGFIAFLQDFRSVVDVTELSKPLSFGLKNQYNIPIVTLEISY